ncbi:hypothetical protein [Bradyrhizobium sp. Cp5.3]|uniref:hypothetical protein n=1 Tax=Bradyrhizobium sp. Cp5.3 TaxID=443598 RepID=UPI0018DD08E4|nr:hypothetical protein [Bradyrhizobium sp. Cp5.3]
MNNQNEMASHYDAGRQALANQNLANQNLANQGFTTEDILWSVGIWSVILTLSPVIVFYMLMVA